MADPESQHNIYLTKLCRICQEHTETAIENFMNYYRKTWPDASITPKLHMLENHAIDFVRRWGTAFGFYGEQGAESIHPTFNKLMATYCQMKMYF
ncbi:uncharacterized protein LOC130629028 isoform X2 [Hydractinia symbiolongicarpus]|uniref:uncharacterized protein LOC130629028 isoform X2 n=1 Tax=Hydractinia symbiolongicarpus TaxID=13093 RepID=UPI00254A3868|nr:uncharacterized protein LOC130629028 isoform X2 [Hydractinia symbiolongicarpus]